MSSFSATSDTLNEYGKAKPRLAHIDWLRAIAVLLMVMVHAAATWQPKTISTTSLLAYVISGLGGLAAPLFVVLTGWGLSKTKLSPRKVIVRVVFFFIMQIILNISEIIILWTHHISHSIIYDIRTKTITYTLSSSSSSSQVNYISHIADLLFDFQLTFL